MWAVCYEQSLIVCGESGSGKTESAKKLMAYLAESTIDRTCMRMLSHLINCIASAHG